MPADGQQREPLIVGDNPKLLFGPGLQPPFDSADAAQNAAAVANELLNPMGRPSESLALHLVVVACDATPSQICRCCSSCDTLRTRILIVTATGDVVIACMPAPGRVYPSSGAQIQGRASVADVVVKTTQGPTARHLVVETTRSGARSYVDEHGYAQTSTSAAQPLGIVGFFDKGNLHAVCTTVRGVVNDLVESGVTGQAAVVPATPMDMGRA